MAYDHQSSTLATARSLVRTALPISAFYFAEILVGLTDLAVVGALGTTELAAVGLAKTILFSIMIVAFGVLSIGTVLMAERSAPDHCGQVVLASMAVAVPFVVVAVLVGRYSGDLLTAGGYRPELIAAFQTYASVLAWAIAPALLFATLKNVLNAVARTGIIIWLSVGIVLGNLIGSIVLVHGIGSWSGLGLVGAAFATFIVNAIAATLLLIHTIHAGLVRFQRVLFGITIRIAGEIVRVGWSAGAQQALESILFIVVLYFLGLYSVQWLAAGTVVFAVMELHFVMSSSLGEVLAARIAAARIASSEDIKRLFLLGSGLVGVCTAALAIIVGLFAETVADVFSSSRNSSEDQALIVELLRLTAPFFLFDAWQIAL